MPNINFSQLWDNQYAIFRKQKYLWFLLVNIIVFAICIGIYLYHTVDQTSYVLYLFIIPLYFLITQKLKRDCVYSTDKYISLIYSRHAVLGYLKSLIDQSTRKDWYVMGFSWWVLSFPFPWCRFVRIRDINKSNTKGD